MGENNKKDLIVTIRCVTYNHEPYIRQCLEGFVMQKTNFRFEAVVHDDASTDGTAKIIQEYATKYPDIIKPILETENQYSKHDGSLARIMNEHTHGKYVAMCEGDDYWTDPYKLQKQVDFLESHPDYSICGHWVESFNENTKVTTDYFTNDITSYGLDYFINGGNWCPTLSVVYRTNALDLNRYLKYKHSIDITLFYHLLTKGPAYCIQEKMAVYRIHNGGIWSGKSGEERITMDFKVRLGIYNVERTTEAATFLRKSLLGDFGRKWMICHLGLMLKIGYIMNKHFGFKYTYKLYGSLFKKKQIK